MNSKILKDTSLVLSYNTISDEGKLVKKSQRFSFIQEDSTVDELLDIGSGIQAILANAVTEMRQDMSYVILGD